MESQFRLSHSCLIRNWRLFFKLTFWNLMRRGDSYSVSSFISLADIWYTERFLPGIGSAGDGLLRCASLFAPVTSFIVAIHGFSSVFVLNDQKHHFFFGFPLSHSLHDAMMESELWMCRGIDLPFMGLLILGFWQLLGWREKSTELASWCMHQSLV